MKDTLTKNSPSGCETTRFYGLQLTIAPRHTLNSQATRLAYADDSVIGTARVLSDCVSNAYLVDIWTLGAVRHHGVARTTIELLLEKRHGQHVHLFTEGSVDFDKKLCSIERPIGIEKVVGQWLVNE